MADERRPLPRRRVVQAAIGAAGLVLAGGPALFTLLQPVQVLPRVGLAPGYRMVDQNSRRLTSDDVRGGITVYGIGHGECGDPCEAVWSRMRGLYDRLDDVEADPLPVRLVSISVDPERDDPAAWAREVAPDADPRIWRFATADTAHLRDVVGTGFESWFTRADDGTVDLQPSLVLVDPLGVKRAVFRYQIPAAERLVLHVREMAKEARATGVAHLAYEAAHLFACYTPL